MNLMRKNIKITPVGKKQSRMTALVANLVFPHVEELIK